MKTIILFVILLLYATAAFSQKEFIRHEFSTFGETGITGLKDNIPSNTKTPLFGGGTGIGYTFFFHPQWGIYTGAEIMFYKISVEESANTSNNTQDISLTENLTLLQIPLMAQFQTRGKNVFFLLGGFKLGFPVHTSYDIDTKNVYIFSGETGMKWKLNYRFSLYTGFYGDIGLNTVIETKDANEDSELSQSSGGIIDGFLKKKTVGALGLKVRLGFHL